MYDEKSISASHVRGKFDLFEGRKLNQNSYHNSRFASKYGH